MYKYPARMERDGRLSRGGAGRSKGRSAGGQVQYSRPGSTSPTYSSTTYQACSSSKVDGGPPRHYAQTAAAGSSSRWPDDSPPRQVQQRQQQQQQQQQQLQQSFSAARISVDMPILQSRGRGSRWVNANAIGGGGEPGPQSSPPRVVTGRNVGDGDTNLGRGGMRGSRPILIDTIRFLHDSPPMHPSRHYFANLLENPQDH